MTTHDVLDLFDEFKISDIIHALKPYGFFTSVSEDDYYAGILEVSDDDTEGFSLRITHGQAAIIIADTIHPLNQELIADDSEEFVEAVINYNDNEGKGATATWAHPRTPFSTNPKAIGALEALDQVFDGALKQGLRQYVKEKQQELAQLQQFT